MIVEKVDRTWIFGGSRSPNKVSICKPAEGSLIDLSKSLHHSHDFQSIKRAMRSNEFLGLLEREKLIWHIFFKFSTKAGDILRWNLIPLFLFFLIGTPLKNIFTITNFKCKSRPNKKKNLYHIALDISRNSKYYPPYITCYIKPTL